MSLIPVPSEQSGASCASCGAALVADQRYCLACGEPASPARLAFLDVLQNEQNRSPAPAAAGWNGQGTIEMTPAGYVPVAHEEGVGGWLRRNSGLLGLLAVLLMCLIVGLLVGHWVSQGSKAPGKQVVEVKGITSPPAVAAATSTAPTSTTGTSAADTSKSNAKAEEAKAEAKETPAEKAPPPKPVKVTPDKIKKLSTSSGKQHQEEINSLGATPIETG